MKKLFFLFAFLGLVSLSANAQKCSGAKSASADKKACCASTAAAAAKAASLDSSIESKTCPVSGKVSYVRKVSDATGALAYEEVEYCTKSKKFVNVSPSEDAKVTCTKKGGSASATNVSMEGDGDAKPACCAKGAEKACCAKGAKKASRAAKIDDGAAASPAKVQMVKGEN